MSVCCRIVNGLLLLLYRGSGKRFEMQLCRSRETQAAKLQAILRQNQDTEYGRKYGFAEISSLEEYRRRVPLTVYEDYTPYIERIGCGEINVLTREPVKLFEITSGSVSASKLIPYTDGLKAEFQQGIKPWLYDLYRRYPGIRRGKSYWSITPAGSERHFTQCGIPIGFEEDGEYFGPVSRLLMNQIFVKPKGAAVEGDMDEFYRRTALALLNTRELTLISVWNPTYLILILDYIHKHRDALLSALPKRRGRELSAALAQRYYSAVWPQLSVISCWCDGAAAGYSRQLAQWFPQAAVQPKGLLATEGFMTFPWKVDGGGVLSAASHFFEFRHRESGEFRNYEDLEEGGRYEIILTTGGGFYRYCIQDVVSVERFLKTPGGQVPILRFAGKTGKVSDLFGEKLNELFVSDVLQGLVQEYQLDQRFFLIAPEGERYVLWLGVRSGVPDETPEGRAELSRRLEQGLCANFHYDYCRRLMQLMPIWVRRVNGNPREAYLQACVKNGQRLGDIKIAVLSLTGGWDQVFEVRDEI